MEDNAVVKWLRGRKTYAIAVAILIAGILQSQGIDIPEYVWAALAAFGAIFLRAGVQKLE